MLNSGRHAVTQKSRTERPYPKNRQELGDPAQHTLLSTEPCPEYPVLRLLTGMHGQPTSLISAGISEAAERRASITVPRLTVAPARKGNSRWQWSKVPVHKKLNCEMTTLSPLSISPKAKWGIPCRLGM